MNIEEKIENQSTIKTQKKIRRHLSLEEKIEQKKQELKEKESQRDKIAKSLRSLQASKMNKDRNNERKRRTRELILLGEFFKEIILQSKNINQKFLENLINTATTNIHKTKKYIDNNKDSKDIKKYIKKSADQEIVLAALIEIKNN